MLVAKRYQWNGLKIHLISLMKSTVFKTVNNQWKSASRNIKSSYEQTIQAKVENMKLGSCEFWKISNKIANRGKSPVLSQPS